MASDRQRTSSRGFTLIELLVVISIIALLSSVALASLNSARDKAKIAKVAQDLAQIERALHLIYSDYGCWPKESSVASGSCPPMPGSGSTQPAISQLVAQPTGLGQYVKQAPTFPFPHDGPSYQYDSDGDEHDAATCASDVNQINRGVNISVGGVDMDVYRAVARMLDGDANPDSNASQRCGKVRRSGGGSLVYSVSATQ